MSAGAGLGLLWIASLLFKVAKSYPPPKPFTYGRASLSILPISIMMLCGATRLFVDENNEWLTAIVIMSIGLTCVGSWGGAFYLHKHIDELIQVNRDLSKLEQVVGEVVNGPREEPKEELLGSLECLDLPPGLAQDRLSEPAATPAQATGTQAPNASQDGPKDTRQ